MRDAVGLRRLTLGVAAGAVHLPFFRSRDVHQSLPEIGSNGVVGHVGALTRDFAVLDFPEDMSAELAVVPLLIDGVRATTVNHDTVFDALDDIGLGRRVGRAWLDVHVWHAEKRIIAPRGSERAASAFLLAHQMRGFAVGLQTDQDTITNERPLLRFYAVVIIPNGANTGAGLVARDIEDLAAVLELSDIGHFHKARARVVRFVPHDAIEFGRVCDDFVNGQHGVRRRQQQIAQPASAQWFGGAHLDGVGRNLLGLRQKVTVLGKLPTAGARYAGIIARFRDITNFGRHAHGRRRREQFLLDVRAFGARKISPFVVHVARHVDRGDTHNFAGLVDNGLGPVLFVRCRNCLRILEHRRFVVADKRSDRSELEIGLLGNRAGFCDLRRDKCHATNFVFRNDWA